MKLLRRLAEIAGKFTKSFRRWFEFDRPKVEAPPPARPAPPIPRPYRLHDPPPGGFTPDMVVDFGTTATVVCLVLPRHYGERRTDVDLEFLAGKTEHPSALTINKDGEVLEVGNSAADKAAPGVRYFTSLKRYVELESRGGTAEGIATPGVDLSAIVSGYLFESIKNAYRASRRKLGANSQIVVSIPNSFNPRALEQIRQGVIMAITKLNGGGEAITAANIRVARESEAIGYLYARSGPNVKAPASGGTLQAERMEWIDLESGREAPAPQRKGRIVVLDVGGGTTDLSLLRMTPAGQGDVRIDVLLNAGVPLGGTDVDRLLLRAALDPANVKDVAGLAMGKRTLVLRGIRQQKETAPEQFFTAEGSSFPALEEIVDRIESKALLRPGAPGDLAAIEYRQEAAERVAALTQLSVDGLFDLIPVAERNDIQAVLLTGRASRLRQIREAVAAKARAMNARVLTLKHPYHLKLAVAYGCALVYRSEFSGDKLPSGTLGRRLRVLTSEEHGAMELDATLPVSGTAPALWEIACPRAEKRVVDYEVWEQSTFLPRDYFGNNLFSFEGLTRLGCSRVVAKWQAPPQAVNDPYRMVLLARDPATEDYYVVRYGHKEDVWFAPEQKGFDLKEENLVTGLPVGFPFEVST